MAVNAELLFNAAPGNYRTRNKTAVTISNNDGGGEYTWEFTLTHRPVGSAAALAYVSPNSRTLTPDVEGTYLIRLVVNGSKVDVGGMALEYHASGLREPSLSETTEWDEDEGWAEAMKNVFERINYGVGARPVAAYNVWGRIWHEPGGTGVPDTLAICLKDAFDVYYWQDLIAGGAAPLYTNAIPIYQAHGGVELGDTFVAQSMQQMLDKILYPYQYPAFTSFSISGQSNPLEVGDNIPAAVTFVWSTSNPANVAVTSVDVDDITRAENVISNTANDGSEAGVLPSGLIQKTAQASHLFRISAQNTKAPPDTFLRNATYSWYWRLYWGTNSSATLNEAGIEALISSMLTGTVPRTYSFAAAPGEYKYLCFDSTLTAPTVWKDQATNLDVPFITVTTVEPVTNAFLIATTYTVQRSLNQLGGAMNIIVS